MGGMKPIITRLFTIFIRAKKITIRPADLKNIPAFELSRMLNELKLMSARTGNVPIAKANMVKAPAMKLPVERV